MIQGEIQKYQVSTRFLKTWWNSKLNWCYPCPIWTIFQHLICNLLRVYPQAGVDLPSNTKWSYGTTKKCHPYIPRLKFSCFHRHTKPRAIVNRRQPSVIGVEAMALSLAGKFSLCLVMMMTSWALHATSRSLPEASTEHKYEQWIADHGSIYADSEEKGKRFDTFADNLRFIEDFNREGNHTLNFQAALERILGPKCWGIPWVSYWIVVPIDSPPENDIIHACKY